MSGLPSSEPIPIPETGYWGWGSSNQTVSNYPNARNLGPGMEEPNLQPNLYVPDDGGSIVALEARVTILEAQIITVFGDIVTIQGDIVTINGDIVTIQGDIATIQAQIIALIALIIPVSFAPFGNTPNANGASVVANVITLQPASVLFPGGVSTGTQTFEGFKVMNKTLSLLENLNLPVTTASIGVIRGGANTLLHTYDNGTQTSIFCGGAAGNLTNTAHHNTGIGYLALNAVANAHSNTAVGANAAQFLSSGSDNVFIGHLAGAAVTTTTNDNVIIGGYAAYTLPTGSTNVFIGAAVGQSMNADCDGNVIVGGNAAGSLTQGYRNIYIGEGCGDSQTTGDYNILIGRECGIGTISPTVSGTLRIANDSGTALTAAYIQGIAGVAPGGTPQVVTINPTTNQLGSSTLTSVVESFTMTLDSGSITSSTVRGAATTTVPIDLSRLGNVVTMTIPALQLITQSGAAATITLTGVGSISATYRPTYALTFVIPLQDNALYTSGIIYVTAGGIVSMQLVSGGFFIVPTGPGYDNCASWVVAA